MARRGPKIALAATILGVGFATALLFRKGDDDKAGAPTEAGESLVLRQSPKEAPQEASTTRLWSGHIEGPQSEQQRDEQVAKAPAPDLKSSPPVAGWPPTSAAPSAGASGAGSTAPSNSVASAPRTAAPPPPAPWASPQPSRAFRPSFEAKPQAAPSRSEPRTHTITDGDTLASIAARYLGRADRLREIYEANKEILVSPDLLPIGTKIRIPDLEERPAASGNVYEVPLVPVPPLPGLSASFSRKAVRTLEVRAGESLVDLARRAYGDGRKHDTIFRANREQLRYPGEIKPGMTLRIP